MSSKRRLNRNKQHPPPPRSIPGRFAPDRPPPLRPTSGTTTTILSRDQVVVSPLLDVPEGERAAIARTVRRAVASLAPTDGGLCFWHAVAGYTILRRRGFEVAIQAGSLQISPDPDDPGLAFEFNGDSPDALERGEFHTWLMSNDGVFIDFTAHTWPDVVERSHHRLSFEEFQAIGGPASAFPGRDLTCEPMHYRQPRLDYVWGAWNALEFVRFAPNRALTTSLWATVAGLNSGPEMTEFVARVLTMDSMHEVIIFGPDGRQI